MSESSLRPDDFPSDQEGQRQYIIARIREIQREYQKACERECKPLLDMLARYPMPILMSGTQLTMLALSEPPK